MNKHTKISTNIPNGKYICKKERMYVLYALEQNLLLLTYHMELKALTRKFRQIIRLNVTSAAAGSDHLA